MKPYQEEYIANIRAYEALSAAWRPEETDLAETEARQKELIERNVELLRGGLLSQMDYLMTAEDSALEDLRAFASALYDGRKETDLGLFCSIRQTLLNLARQREDRDGAIRELYWLGIGRHALNSHLTGMPMEIIGPYQSRMRLCFAEAAASLKYFEETDNEDTRSYIMRSMANVALGQFKSVGERTGLLKRAMRVFQDPFYRELAPALPWDRYVRQTRQLMISSLSYGREHAMSPRDVADIMESAHIVYQGNTRPEDVPLARQSFHLYSIEYFCGLYDMNTLLTKLELMMDKTDIRDYSGEGMYSLISLPAFYSQYLQNYPEALTPSRERYIARLYRRIQKYVAAFPAEREGTTLFLYLRQLSYTFVETAHGLPYSEFAHTLLARFAPEIYREARSVAAGAMALCEALLDREPGFFDDIEAVRSAGTRSEKREAVLKLAEQCGELHDIGKLNFLDLYTRTVRQWFPEEDDLARLHVVTGSNMLTARPSTARLAPAALGHHTWYDGTHPYPGGYRRSDCPERRMVDVIGLADWLVDVTGAGSLHTGRQMTFREAAAEAAQLEGRQFSPHLTALLRDPALAERLRSALDRGRTDALRDIAAVQNTTEE